MISSGRTNAAGGARSKSRTHWRTISYPARPRVVGNEAPGVVAVAKNPAASGMSPTAGRLAGAIREVAMAIGGAILAAIGGVLRARVTSDGRGKASACGVGEEARAAMATGASAARVGSAALAATTGASVAMTGASVAMTGAFVAMMGASVAMTSKGASAASAATAMAAAGSPSGGWELARCPHSRSLVNAVSAAGRVFSRSSSAIRCS